MKYISLLYESTTHGFHYYLYLQKIPLITQDDRTKKIFFNPWSKHNSLKDSMGGNSGYVWIPVLTQNCSLTPGDFLNLSNFLICQKRKVESYHKLKWFTIYLHQHSKDRTIKAFTQRKKNLHQPTVLCILENHITGWQWPHHTCLLPKSILPSVEEATTAMLRFNERTMRTHSLHWKNFIHIELQLALH